MDRLGKELLQEATKTIDERGEKYGTPLDNFSRIARLWSVILDTDITPLQAALCMDAVKTARLCTTPEHWDSLVDKAGYSAVMAEIVGERQKIGTDDSS
jgi:hypothetical protein|tara:strand:- start:137 stop:433 length:297 start_codon:yes stop_codon:yes gene_type:complete